MKIVYDPPKRAANLLKHGLDFADLEDGGFFEMALVLPAKLGRFRAIGRSEDGTIAVALPCSAVRGFPSSACGRPAKRERSLFDAHQ